MDLCSLTAYLCFFLLSAQHRTRASIFFTSSVVAFIDYPSNEIYIFAIWDISGIYLVHLPHKRV